MRKLPLRNTWERRAAALLLLKTRRFHRDRPARYRLARSWAREEFFAQHRIGALRWAKIACAFTDALGPIHR